MANPEWTEPEDWGRMTSPSILTGQGGEGLGALLLADSSAWGPINGMGEDDPNGSYVRVSVAVGNRVQRFKISAGAAEVLAAELVGALDRRSLRSRVSTTDGRLVQETDAQISNALRWYRRQGSRQVLMAQIDDLVAALQEARDAIATLDEFALGGVDVPDFYTGDIVGQYGIRDELLSKLNAALSLALGESK